MSGTRWQCQHCCAGGVVDHDAHAGVYEVLNLIAAAHGSACPTGLERVRISLIDRAGESNDRIHGGGT